MRKLFCLHDWVCKKIAETKQYEVLRRKLFIDISDLLELYKTDYMAFCLKMRDIPVY